MTSSDIDSAEYKRALKKYQKSRKNDAEVDTDQWSPFRKAEKFYKRKYPPPELTDVLDLTNPNPEHVQEISTGTKQLAYTVNQIPGLVVIPGFVSEQKQRELVQWSIADQARAPNLTNLDVHYLLPKEGLWNLACARPDAMIEPLLLLEDENVVTAPPGPRQLISNAPVTADSVSAAPRATSAPSTTAKPSKVSDLIPRLRWANIGWFYHWGEKQYDFSKGKEPVHPNLREICKGAVDSVDWEIVHGQASDLDWGEGPDWHAWGESYEPDAGIVNFYQTKDTLMAHVDRSEVCATSPLVSISLGNSAVFLIGGLTREVEPVPILLRSGDLVIMSGPACRRAYHGVPRILEGTLPAHLNAIEDGDEDWKRYAELMQTTRININVRQVFPKGFEIPK